MALVFTVRSALRIVLGCIGLSSAARPQHQKNFLESLAIVQRELLQNSCKSCFPAVVDRINCSSILEQHADHVRSAEIYGEMQSRATLQEFTGVEVDGKIQEFLE